MQRERSEDENNPFVMLRLGSGKSTSSSDSGDRVIFTDPCSECGNKKRRLSPHQESIIKTRKKPMFIKPTSATCCGGTTYLEGSDSFIRSIYGSIPFPIPSSPIPTPSPTPSPLDSRQHCNSVPLISTDSNNLNPQGPPTPLPSVSFPSPNTPAIAALIQTPASQTLTYSGRLSTSPGSLQTSTEGSPANASLPPRPPTLRRSDSDPTISSSNPQTPTEGSPANASLPPRPPTLHRSVSDPTPARTPMAMSNGDQKTILTTSGQSFCVNTFVGSPDSATGGSSTPREKRRKRMRDRLAEMNKWVESMLQEQDQEGEIVANNSSEVKNVINKNDTCEIVPEENVEAERDGDTFRVRCKCCCGRWFQIVFSI